MGLTPDLVGAGWLWLMNLVLVIVVGLSIWHADWAQLAVERSLQHSVFAAAVLLMLVWQMRAGLSPGLTIHIFGITAVTLMLGWAFAILAGTVALVFMVILGKESLIMLGVNGIITVAIPAFVSYGIMLWERSRGFRNFFAYLFVCGFFGAAIAVASAGLCMVFLLWVFGVYDWETLVHEYVRYLPLIMLPEAFVNGTVTSGLMVFHPQRLLTLDESRYL
ncbi:energy-coupling factor ABC transporter permease [Marinobacter fonticola]|uniref:energy-coupling factor ABC transporter permease n=1 Tax=Marinobacter fonticola TaxID=2603215 RepID=UPI0011E6E989|nr:energy-coupling factor ABC transporter permease [Marinobacter fonticola]